MKATKRMEVIMIGALDAFEKCFGDMVGLHVGTVVTLDGKAYEVPNMDFKARHALFRQLVLDNGNYQIDECKLGRY